ncbi:MAG TPA: transglutaminase family protein [Rhizomicrobium sp.]|jgi:transglutaminase-like putative cysteine protease
MLIRCGYEIGFECTAPTPMMFMINVRPERQPDLKTPENVQRSPAVAHRTYTDGFGNICTRLIAPAGVLTITNDFVIADSGLPDAVPTGAMQHPVDDLPDDVIVYLLGSRYCETDRMSDLAWSLFGSVEPGWTRVQAILDYAHNRITFGYQHARSDKTAWSAHEEQRGVCRDYAHLAITLCRCMNIPARYCTGYLGDIGVPLDPNPMDFSAWFEVYLGGQWHAVDARHNTPRIGRIPMAHGRDATDAAISTAFGSAKLVMFKVVTEEVADV